MNLYLDAYFQTNTKKNLPIPDFTLSTPLRFVNLHYPNLDSAFRGPTMQPSPMNVFERNDGPNDGISECIIGSRLDWDFLEIFYTFLKHFHSETLCSHPESLEAAFVPSLAFFLH